MNALGSSLTNNGNDPCLNLAEKEFIKIIASSSQDQTTDWKTRLEKSLETKEC